MAQYPSSAAGDSNLYVAVNNLETLLVGALGATGGNNGADIEVSSTTGFPTSGFITVGNEAIAYTSLLATPPRFSGITRGSDGTIGVVHADSNRVRLTQIAAHHNALKEEVKAIETDLLTGNPPLRKVGGTMTGAILFPDGSASTPSIAFANDTNTGLYLVASDYIVIATGGTSKVGISGTAVSTNIPTAITGTTTNDSAAAGYVGEYVSSFTQSGVTPSNTWIDLTSISLTAGDWDVTIYHNIASNTGTITQSQVGISTTSGNTAPAGGHGDDIMVTLNPPAAGGTAANNAFASITKRYSFASTTIVYYKVNCVYTVGNPSAYGTIRARRVR